MYIVYIGRNAYNYLYKNNDDGSFTRMINNGIDNDNISASMGCTVGDINNDGYLDIFIGNTVDITNGQTWVINLNSTIDLFRRFEFNQLLLNNGDLTFTDISESSGILNTVFNRNPEYNGSPTLTWGVAMIDINLGIEYIKKFFCYYQLKYIATFKKIK